MRNKTPTIRDVAALAGVSITTVSKYINGVQRFSEPVEHRMRQAIEQLDYRSNPLARSMITGKTKTIGVVILDIKNPHFTSIVKGANRVALEHGYALLFIDTGENLSREVRLLEALSRRVDGLIVSSRMSEEYMVHVMEFGKPVVFFGRSTRPDLPSVGSDGYRAARMVGDLLVGQGHRHVAYLGFPKSRWDKERMRGLTHCLQEHGLPFYHFEVEGVSPSDGEQACSLILQQKTRPDALVCYNDMLAIGVMKELIKQGIKIPSDMSIVGFDNVMFGQYTLPTLTTVDMQSERSGELAMQLLLRQINEGISKDIGYTMLEPRLILRDSTAVRT